MPKAAPALTSFNSGEWSKRMAGRSDLDRHPASSRTMDNFLPLVQGPAFKRSGTRFVAPAVAVADSFFSYTDAFNLTPGTTGPVVRTNYGFRPEAIIVWLIGTTSSVDVVESVDAVMSIGFGVDTGQQYVAALGSDDGAGTTNSTRAFSTTEVVLEISVITGATVGSASLASRDDDGVTLNIDTAFSVGYRVLVTALGGAAIENATVGTFTQRSTAGVDLIETLAFQPDTLLIAGHGSSTASGTEAMMCVGAAAGASSIANAVTTVYSQNNVTTTDTNSYSFGGECYARTTSGSVAARASVTDWLTNGFEMTYHEATLSGIVIGFLALNTGDTMRITEITTETNTSVDIDITGLPHRPTFAMFGSCCRPEDTLDTVSEDGVLSLGFLSLSGQNCQAYGDEDGDILATNITLALDDDSVYQAPVAGATSPPRVDGVMRVTEVGTTGGGSLKMRMTDADDVNSFVWVLTGGKQTVSTKQRLVPFTFSNDDAHVLEFGDRYMRVYTDDGIQLETAVTITGATQANPVVITTSAPHGYFDGNIVFIQSVGGMVEINQRFFLVVNAAGSEFSLLAEDGTGHTAYTTGGTSSRTFQIISPYAEEDLAALDWEQSADVLYLANPGYPPYKLERRGNTDWTLSEIDFDWFPFAPENTDDSNNVAASADTGQITLTSDAGEFTAAMVGTRIKLREIIETQQPEWIPNETYPETSATANYAAFVSGGTIQEEDRVFFETRVYELLTKRGAGTGETGRNPPRHEFGVGTDSYWDWTFINWGYGYVVITSFTDAFRVDATVVKTLPRSVVSADVTIITTTAANPVSVNATGAEFETGDQVFIRGVTTATELNDRKFTITRVDADNFTLDNENGSTYGAGSGGTVTRMFFAFRGDTNAEAGTFPVLHHWSFGAWSVVRGYPKAVEIYEDRLLWAGTTEDPFTIWFSQTGEFENHLEIAEDTAALVVTLSTSDPIQWLSAQSSLQIGDGGSEFASPRVGDPLVAATVHTIRRKSTYGSRASVHPVRLENVLLFVTKDGKKLRELVFNIDSESNTAPDLTKLNAPITDGILKEMAFASAPLRQLWGVLEDGGLRAMTYERTESVVSWTRHTLGGTDVSVQSVASVPHPDGTRTRVWMIVDRTVDGQTAHFVEYFEADFEEGDAIADAFFVDAGLTYDGVPATAITGLNYLEGESVNVLADGLVIAGHTVLNGALDPVLAVAASKVQVGLAYSAGYESQKLEAGSAIGSAQGSIQRIPHVSFRLDQMGGKLEYGPELSLLRNFFRPAAGTLFTDDTKILAWPAGLQRENGARIAFQHSDPLPCTVVAVYPKLGTQD